MILNENGIGKIFNVIIVEDEPLILESISEMVEKAHSGFKVVAQAYDGEEALSMISELKPDLVITDIRMPVMDGLALLTKMKEKALNPVTVILSGYQEFEYAKKALKLGVEDYLLKPISIEKIKDLLVNLYEKLSLERLQLQLKIFQDITDSRKSNSPDSANFSQYFDYDAFTYILLCAGSYCIFPNSWITPSQEFWFGIDLDEILNEIIGKDTVYWIVDGISGNEKIIVFGINKFVKENFPDKCSQLHIMLSRYNFPITTIMGETEIDLADLSRLIQMSRIALNRYVVFGKSQLITDTSIYKYQKSNPQIDIVNKETMSLIIGNKKKDLCKNELEKLLKQLEDISSCQLQLERTIKYFVGIFKAAISSLGEDRINYIDMEINELLSNSTDYYALYDGMCFIIDDMLDSYEVENTNYQKHFCDRVEQYIKSNFTKQLSLKSLAQNFGLVAPYLSSIYKKHKGISPSGQITSLRIEKAKELLKNGSAMLLKDIAELSGYNDQLYFSKAFKSITGKTPSEFREE